MRIGPILTASLAALLGCGTAAAQLLPGAPRLPPVDDAIGRLGGVVEAADRSLQDARALARTQAARAQSLARRYPDQIALDDQGHAARAGELIVIASDADLERRAIARGFAVIERVAFPELDLDYTRFSTPSGVSLKRSLRRLKSLAGTRDVTSDVLHFASGTISAAPQSGRRATQAAGGHAPIGIIDGGVPAQTPGLARQQSFARGGVRANGHAIAIASLLTGGAGVQASAPGAALHVADVFGNDPAGGNAAAIGQALAWMVRARIPVVVASLAGPPNPLLARIVAAARARGTLLVAAVGNDGPAAPPAYPASYPQAIAVTGVDRQQRILIEAGRARKVDYAAPGADLLALGADGRARPVRGTSFAAPFVAARLAAHIDAGAEQAIAALDREARDLGARGPDARYGRGLVCGACATRTR